MQSILNNNKFDETITFKCHRHIHKTQIHNAINLTKNNFRTKNRIKSDCVVCSFEF